MCLFESRFPVAGISRCAWVALYYHRIKAFPLAFGRKTIVFHSLVNSLFYVTVELINGIVGSFLCWHVHIYFFIYIFLFDTEGNYNDVNNSDINYDSNDNFNDDDNYDNYDNNSNHNYSDYGNNGEHNGKDDTNNDNDKRQ